MSGTAILELVLAFIDSPLFLPTVLVVAGYVGYLWRRLRGSLTPEQLQKLQDAAWIAVTAVQQQFGGAPNEVLLAKAIEGVRTILGPWGISLDEARLRLAVEAAVWAFRAQERLPSPPEPDSPRALTLPG